MACLLAPSPVLLLQNFPRSQRELLRAAHALGNIQGLIEKKSISLIATPVLRDFIADFDWSDSRTNGIKQEIYALLSRWFLSGNSSVLFFKVEMDASLTLHPVPAACEEDIAVQIWSAEMASLLQVHDLRMGNDLFCIGVACDSAFSGDAIGSYKDLQVGQRYFPLVGPHTTAELADSEIWLLDEAVKDIKISVAEAAKNLYTIGADSVFREHASSHIKVTFPGRRPWVLDVNVDPVADRFLGQLVEISGYPIGVIKYALRHGILPSKVSVFG